MPTETDPAALPPKGKTLVISNDPGASLGTTGQQDEFTGERLELPSRGLLYPKGHPASSGAIMVRPMTTKEEEILVTERFHIADCPNGEGFTGGAEWDLGGVVVRAVHAPGHTAGHSVFVIESDLGVRSVVTGDIDLSTFGPYYGDAASSLDAFESTLAMARGIEADHYVTFHHKGVVEGHAAFAAAVDQYGVVFGRRHDALLALLADGASHTLDALVEHGIVYRAGTRPPVFGTSVERRTIEQHLARAVERGDVAVVPSDGVDDGCDDNAPRYRVAR